MFDRKAYMKEYHKNHYAQNRAHILKRMKEYQMKNKQHLNTYQTEWYRLNEEKLRLKAKNYHNAHKDQAASAKLKKNYGITLEYYNRLLADQNGRCAICSLTSTKRLHVDHNHTTGKIRGLLCSKCNLAIGLFRDDFNILHAAKLYLLRSH